MVKFLLIIFGIYLILKYILPIVLRVALGRVIAKTQQQYRGQQPFQGEAPKAERESTSSTSTTHGKKPIIDDNQGEYVDYVEIK
jgi:hypothetical protein